jgi:hypothetical protein
MLSVLLLPLLLLPMSAAVAVIVAMQAAKWQK